MATGKRARYGVHGGVALALTAMLVIAQGSMGTASASERAASQSSYNCGQPLSQTFLGCYATNGWLATPGQVYYGALADISVVHLTSDPASACDVFNPDSCSLENGMWLLEDSYQDTDATACLSTAYAACWVGVGYRRDVALGQYFFWEQSLPVGFAGHLLGPVQDPADYSTRYHFIIVAGDPKYSPNTFGVFVYNGSTTKKITTYYHVVSPNNPMAANEIIIGQRLRGTSGASAQQATFTHNIWAHSPLHANISLTGGWFEVVTQKFPGDWTYADNPPFGLSSTDAQGEQLWATDCC